jgi:hypothetical protein
MARDRAQQRRLAHSVPAEQRDGLPGIDFQAKPVENVTASHIADHEILDFELHAARPR